MKSLLFTQAVWVGKKRVLDETGEAVTRRVIKPQPHFEHGLLRWAKGQYDINLRDNKDLMKYAAPYRAGEVVYVKESWHYYGGDEYIYQQNKRCVMYKLGHSYEASNLYVSRWRSPLFMPEWAARYFIQITRVDARRTRDITPEDCLAEGIERHEDSGHNIFWFEIAGDYHGDTQRCTPQEAYFALYDSINGEGAHEKNWDFCYEFK